MTYPFSVLIMANSTFRPLMLAGASTESNEISTILQGYSKLAEAADQVSSEQPIAAAVNLFTLGWTNGVRGQRAIRSFMKNVPDQPAAILLKEHNGSFIKLFQSLMKEKKLILFPISLSQFPLTSYPLKGAALKDIQLTAQIWRSLFKSDPPSVWLPKGAYMPGIDQMLKEEGCSFVCLPSHAFPENERNLVSWVSPHGLPLIPYEFNFLPQQFSDSSFPLSLFYEKKSSMPFDFTIFIPPVKNENLINRVIHIPFVYENQETENQLLSAEDLKQSEKAFQIKKEWTYQYADCLAATSHALDVEWAYCVYASLYGFEEEKRSAANALRYLLDGVKQDFVDVDFAQQRMKLHYGIDLAAPLLAGKSEYQTADGAILLLTWEYPPNTVGGMARHVHGLAEALVQSGRSVIVLTEFFQGTPEYEFVNGVHIYRSGPLHNGEENFIKRIADLNVCLFQKGEEIIRKHDVSLVHTHDWLTGDAALLLARRFGLPVVSTIHATEYGRNNGLYNDLQRKIAEKEKQLIAASDTIIVCSYPMKEELHNHYEAAHKTIHVIPNGVEFENKAGVTGRFDHMQPFVFSIGRMVFEKGFQTFFELSLKSLKKWNIQFIIAGKGPLLEEWRKEVKKRGLEENIHFVGYVSDEERKRLFELCEAAVFPSLYEPFGIVALEAMAFKKPVIASASGGLKSFVLHEQTGLLFEPGNAEDLAAKLETVLKQPEWANELGINACKIAEELYSWTHISKQTEKVYDQTIFIKKMEGAHT